MAFIRLGDIVVHHAAAGGPEQPAIVFANSLGTDLRVWDALHARLAGRFRLVRYDKRGHGLTDLTPGPYTIEGLAEDLATLCDRLQVESAVVCGLSIGGMIAQRLAAARPDLVRGLVLMDTAHKIGTAEMWQQRIEAVRGGGIAAIADAVLERWFAPPFREGRPDEVAGWRNMLTRTPVEGYLACCAAIRIADLTEAARAITVPTLCLVGDADGSTPPDLVRALADLVPDSRYEVVGPAGHIPCVEQPEIVAGLISRFIEETGLAG
jgi:3-oxoadipate enol-lactonase